MLYCSTKVIGLRQKEVKTISVRNIRGCGEKRRKERENSEWVRERERERERERAPVSWEFQTGGGEGSGHHMLWPPGLALNIPAAATLVGTLAAFSGLCWRFLPPPANGIFYLRSWFKTWWIFACFWADCGASGLTVSGLWGNSGSSAGIFASAVCWRGRAPSPCCSTASRLDALTSSEGKTATWGKRWR